MPEIVLVRGFYTLKTEISRIPIGFRPNVQQIL